MGNRRKIGIAVLYALVIVIIFDIFVTIFFQMIPPPFVGMVIVTMAIALAFIAARFYRGEPFLPR